MRGLLYRWAILQQFDIVVCISWQFSVVLLVISFQLIVSFLALSVVLQCSLIFSFYFPPHCMEYFKLIFHYQIQTFVLLSLLTFMIIDFLFQFISGKLKCIQANFRYIQWKAEIYKNTASEEEISPNLLLHIQKLTLTI